MRITGEVFDPENNQPVLFTDVSTLARTDPGRAIIQYDVGLRPGTNAQAYANAVGSALGPTFFVGLNGTDPLYVSSSASPLELILLALSGLVIAWLGALLPATWAARARADASLRTE